MVTMHSCEVNKRNSKKKKTIFYWFIPNLVSIPLQSNFLEHGKINRSFSIENLQ